MSPLLLASAAPGKALHSALEQLAAAAAADLAALPENPSDRIHDIRVGMKKFRALLRLVDPPATLREIARLDALAKTIKDAFGADRDLAVGLDLLRQLVGRRQAAALAADWTSAEDPASPSAPSSAALWAVEKLRALLVATDLDGFSPEHLREAWIASYRAGRRALAVCQTARNDDFLFHELRKRVKQLLYQAVALGPQAGDLVPDAQQLSTALGLLHDLAVLQQRLPTFDEETDLVLQAKKRRAAREALRLAKKVFHDKPGDLRDRLVAHA